MLPPAVLQGLFATNQHNSYSSGMLPDIFTLACAHQSAVAALTFLIYDIIISFSREASALTFHGSATCNTTVLQVTYIWGSKLSIPTALYFLARYFTLVNLMCVPLYCVTPPVLKSTYRGLVVGVSIVTFSCLVLSCCSADSDQP